jgi:hypothetical protein
MTVFLLLWLFVQALSTLLVWHFTWGLGRPISVPRAPRVAVLVAVKGHDVAFDEFFDGLMHQAYPDYRVIFAVEADDDPVVAAIEARRVDAPDRLSLVVAGLSVDEGQKITNLRAALARVTQEDEILVIADADMWPAPDWLLRLVQPLVAGGADVVSAYPWLVLQDRALSTLVLASISAGIATLPRAPFLDAAWGGSMAIRRDRFETLSVTDAWRGAISDDLQLTNVVIQAGGSIVVPRELLLRTPADTSGFASVVDQAQRWYALVRLHMPVTYALAVAGTTFMAGGWIAGIVEALTGARVGMVTAVGALALATVRAGGRAILVARLWGRRGLAENRAFLLADPLVSPLAAIVNAGLAWSSLRIRRVTWAGVAYELGGVQEIKVLSRERHSAGPAAEAIAFRRT